MRKLNSPHGSARMCRFVKSGMLSRQYLLMKCLIEISGSLSFKKSLKNLDHRAKHQMYLLLLAVTDLNNVSYFNGNHYESLSVNSQFGNIARENPSLFYCGVKVIWIINMSTIPLSMV